MSTSMVQAAQILNVSRVYLVNLIEDCSIPHLNVGSRRRLRIEDVMAYKERVDAERESVLDELALEAQLHGMSYGNR